MSNVGYATVLRFTIERMRVDAVSIEKKMKKKKEKRKRKRYGIRVAYRTFHQRNALPDTRQHHYRADEIRACVCETHRKQRNSAMPKLKF